MLKIQRAASDAVVFTVAGRLDPGNVGELLSLLAEEAPGRAVVLDLRDLILVDRDAIRALLACQGRGILLRNCPQYIRLWMQGEKDQPLED